MLRPARRLLLLPLLLALAGRAEAFFCFGFGGGDRSGPQAFFPLPPPPGPPPFRPVAPPSYTAGLPEKPVAAQLPERPPEEVRGWRFRPLK